MSGIRTRLSWNDWKLVLLLASINFTHILDFVIVMPLGDQLRHELFITPQQFGFVVSAYGIAATISGILAALVIDRFDRKKTMLVSFAGFTAMTFYCGVAPNFIHLLIARSLAGAFGGVVASTIMAFIVDLVVEERRGRAIGVVTSAFAFASTIGLPIGLTLANWFQGFGAPFLAIAVLGAVVWCIGFWALPTLTSHKQLIPRNMLHQFSDVVRQSNHLWSFAFMLAMVLGTFMIVPFIAPYFQANCGMAREELPWVYLVGGISTLVAMNGVGWLTDRFGARPIFLLSAGSAVVMTIVITNLPAVGLVLSVLSAATFMTVASSRIVPAQAMMLRCAVPAMRGAFTSLNAAVSHLATGIGPLMAGAMIGEEYAGGPLTHYWMAGAVAATFGMVAMILSFRLKPPIAHSSPSVS